jgi:hypothetical protein
MFKKNYILTKLLSKQNIIISKNVEKRHFFSLEGRGKEDFKFRKKIIASSVPKKKP